MGKPQTTYFCGNGHILENNPEHCFGEYDWDEEMNPLCPYCGNTEVFMITGWNEEVESRNVESDEPWDWFRVSPIPIRHDEIQKTDFKGNIYYVLIPAYDISKLKGNRE